MNTITVRHSFNAGDIIYSLWAVREACRRNNAKAVYLQWLNRPAFFYEGATHPTKNDKGVEVSMNEKMFTMLNPLMESLPYIRSFEPYTGQQAISLDRTREIQCGMPNGDIRRWPMYAYPDMQCDTSLPVIMPEDIQFTDEEKEDARGFRLINLPYAELLNEAIIVNRTSRYRNPTISYGFLQRIGLPIYFAGTLDEYAEFQDLVPRAIYLHVIDFKWLAKYISSCKLFIGNQSFCYSLAEAMKTPRLLEVCAFAPNVIPTGPNGYDYYDQQAFEMLVNELIK